MIKNIIIEGKTGCGKTFTAINEARKIGRFAYIAPTRQLVYETAIKYGTHQDIITSGECHIYPDNPENFFGVYESLLHTEDLKKYQTVIIDEAHYITDTTRGLNTLIEDAQKENLNIFLLTGTRNFKKLKGFEIKKLKPIKKYKKKKISSSEFFKRMKDGIPSIYFHKYKSNCGEYGGAVITNDTPSAQRLQYQLDFTSGKIKFIETTNALAQGLNFPAQNIYIEHNEWDTPEVIAQKIGRLGRYGLTGDNDLLTYCCEYCNETEAISQIKKISSKEMEEEEKRKKEKEMQKREKFAEFAVNDFLPYILNKYGKNFIEKDKTKIKKFLKNDDFFKLFFYGWESGWGTEKEITLVLRGEIYDYKSNDDKNYYEYNNRVLKQLINLYLFFRKYFNLKKIFYYFFPASFSPRYTFKEIKKQYIKEKRKEKELEKLILQNIKN